LIIELITTVVETFLTIAVIGFGYVSRRVYNYIKILLGNKHARIYTGIILSNPNIEGWKQAKILINLNCNNSKVKFHF